MMARAGKTGETIRAFQDLRRRVDAGDAVAIAFVRLSRAVVEEFDGKECPACRDGEEFCLVEIAANVAIDAEPEDKPRPSGPSWLT